MPFETPTLPALIARAQSDLDGATALRRSDAQALARVQAGGAYGLYGYLAWLARQIMPDTCDDDMLPRHAALRPIPARFDPTRARGYARATGTPGARLLQGALLQREGGVRYRVTAETALLAGPTAVPVEAVTDGALGNASPGTALSLVSPSLGVASQLTVDDSGLTGGVEQETLDAYRQRLLRSYRVLPHGGNADDYETWALEVPGVTRAWCVRRWMGPGTVAVFFVRDGDADPIPNAAQCAAVQAYIEAQQSVIPEVYALAPTQVPVAYRIRVTPDTVPVRAAVERALLELHAAEADLGAPLLISHIREAISGAAGERDHTLYEPAGDVPAESNQLLTFGGIVWS